MSIGFDFVLSNQQVNKVLKKKKPQIKLNTIELGLSIARLAIVNIKVQPS